MVKPPPTYSPCTPPAARRVAEATAVASLGQLALSFIMAVMKVLGGLRTGGQEESCAYLLMNPVTCAYLSMYVPGCKAMRNHPGRTPGGRASERDGRKAKYNNILAAMSWLIGGSSRSGRIVQARCKVTASSLVRILGPECQGMFSN